MQDDMNIAATDGNAADIVTLPPFSFRLRASCRYSSSTLFPLFIREYQADR